MDIHCPLSMNGFSNPCVFCWNFSNPCHLCLEIIKPMPWFANCTFGLQVFFFEFCLVLIFCISSQIIDPRSLSMLLLTTCQCLLFLILLRSFVFEGPCLHLTSSTYLRDLYNIYQKMVLRSVPSERRRLNLKTVKSNIRIAYRDKNCGT